MRRLVSIALLLVFGFPLLSSMLDATRTAESRLPVCCRRNGAHRCAMTAADGQSAPAVRGVCPMQGGLKGWSHHAPASLDLASLLFAGVVSHPAQLAQIEAWARVAEEGARHKRGPPVVVLS